MRRINPFRPNGPIPTDLFVGRTKEFEQLESFLVQTINGNPTNFTVLGERGIGKTSLFEYTRLMATTMLDVENDEIKYRFLVPYIIVDPSTTQLDLVRKIELSLRQELGRTEKARQFLEDVWTFLRRFDGVNVAGVSFKRGEGDKLGNLLREEFANSLAQVVERSCSDDADSIFAASLYEGVAYDGILILIDEADRSSDDLDLGAFIKYLSEDLGRKGCHKVQFGLSGLPSLKDKLLESHRSSSRGFYHINLARLNTEDSLELLEKCLQNDLRLNNSAVAVTEGAINRLQMYADGHPHFLHQFGFHAYDNDTDGELDTDDIDRGAFCNGGAIDVVGDIYFDEPYCACVRTEEQRAVLRLFSVNPPLKLKEEQVCSELRLSRNSVEDALRVLCDASLMTIDSRSQRYHLSHSCLAYWLAGREEGIVVDQPTSTP